MHLASQSQRDWTFFSGLFIAFLVLAPVHAETFHLVADVPLSGPSGRFDYQSIDPETHRLFLSHMVPGSLVVFDLQARREIADLPGFPGATGVMATPTRSFVSITGHWWNAVTGGGAVAALDTHTLKTLWRTRAGQFPDGIVIARDRLFVSDERGEQELVLDAASGRLLATIPLGGEAGMSVYDAKAGRVLVNVQTKDEIAAIDPASDRIANRFKLPGSCENNHGLLLAGDELFVACDHNAKLLVLAVKTMAVSHSFDVGDEPDVLALDSARGRLYVASESGTVSVFDVKTPAKLAQTFVAKKAHSVAVDPATGLVYLPLADQNVLRILEFR